MIDIAAIAQRDRIEAVLERQSYVSDEIDVLAGFVARLPDVRLTVAQSRRLEIIAAELMRRAENPEVAQAKGVECRCRGEAANVIECSSRRGVPAHPGPAPLGSSR